MSCTCAAAPRPEAAGNLHAALGAFAGHGLPTRAMTTAVSVAYAGRRQWGPVVHFRVYLLDKQGRIEAAESFVAVDDDAAMGVATDLYGTLSDTFSGYELWQGNRRVETAGPRAAQQPDYTNWADAHRRQMLELEDCLARGFECVRTSRQLMEAVDRLLDGQDRPPGLVPPRDGG